MVNIHITTTCRIGLMTTNGDVHIGHYRPLFHGSDFKGTLQCPFLPTNRYSRRVSKALSKSTYKGQFVDNDWLKLLQTNWVEICQTNCLILNFGCEFYFYSDCNQCDSLFFLAHFAPKSLCNHELSVACCHPMPYFTRARPP